MRQVLCPVLVARDDELTAITAAIRQAHEGRGGAVFVLGEPGLGKSRLAREAGAVARGQGLEVLVGRATSGRASPFRALSEALQGALRGGLPASSDLDAFRPFLAPLVPEWHQAGIESSDVSLAEGVLRLLRLAGAQDGCLLVLEDLQ
ncbi:MAG: ATP-binding protein, partial [Gemmatimonadales bacterium]